MEIIETYLDQAGVKKTLLGYKYLVYAIDVYRPWMQFCGEKGLYKIVGDAFGEKWKTVNRTMARALQYALYVEEDEIKPKKFIKTASDILFGQGEDNAKSTL